MSFVTSNMDFVNKNARFRQFGCFGTPVNLPTIALPVPVKDVIQVEPDDK